MKTYQSFGALAKALKRNQIEIPLGIAAAMEISAIAVTGAAKAELGTYQRDDMGQSEPWEELKQATKNDRLRQGYSENDPLLRSGELWASIGYTAGEKMFAVGSTDKISEYQEMGTPKLPPRHFLAPALYRNIPFVLNTIGDAIAKAIAGEV